MQKHTRKPDALTLAARQGVAQFADRRVQSLRQTLDQAGQSRLPTSLDKLIGGGIGLCKRDVVPHRAGEQVRLLRHVAFYVAKGSRVHISDILPGYAYAAIAGIPESHEQLAKR